MSYKKILMDWKLHLTILVCCMISDRIGTITIPITEVISVSLLPLLYSMVLVTIIYLIKPIKWVGIAQTDTADTMLSMTCLVLMAKLGCNVGTSVETLVDASLPVVLLSLIHI